MSFRISDQAYWQPPAGAETFEAHAEIEGAWLARRVTLDAGDVLVPVPDETTMPTRADVQAALDALPEGHTLHGLALPGVRLSRHQYVALFTPEEFCAIEDSVDPRVRQLRHMVIVAEDIDLAHPTTVMGVHYLEAIGLIAPGRAVAILSSDV